MRTGALYRLVHDFSPDQHILQIDPQRISQARHLDNLTVPLSLLVVLRPDRPSIGLPIAKAKDSGIEEWTQATILGRGLYGTSTLDLPVVRSSAKLIRYIENPSVAGSYYQGIVAIVHGSCISDSF